MTLSHEQRGRADSASALGGVFNLDIPNLLAGLGVQGNQAVFSSAHKEHSKTNRQPSSASVTCASVLGRLIGIIPKQLSGDRIQSEDVVILIHEIQFAVSDDWRRFQAAASTCRKSPGREKPVHVLRRDLVQRAIAPSSVIAVEREPILRLLRGMHDALGGDVLARSARCTEQTKRKKKQPDADCESPHTTPQILSTLLICHIALHSIEAGFACV